MRGLLRGPRTSCRVCTGAGQGYDLTMSKAILRRCTMQLSGRGILFLALFAAAGHAQPMSGTYRSGPAGGRG